jgi:hypothetical protein
MSAHRVFFEFTGNPNATEFGRKVCPTEGQKYVHENMHFILNGQNIDHVVQRKIEETMNGAGFVFDCMTSLHECACVNGANCLAWRQCQRGQKSGSNRVFRCVRSIEIFENAGYHVY